MSDRVNEAAFDLDKAVADMRKVLPSVVAEIERRATERATAALDVERLAQHWPLRIDEAGNITCECDAIVDHYDNGWWRHVVAEYARLSGESE